MRRSLLIALALLGSGFLAGHASGAPADVHVTLEAAEGPDCDPTGQQVACFLVTNGSLEDLPAGGTVHLMLENAGQLDHNVFVTDAANADENNADTAGGDAIASTDTVSAGGNASVSFTVPSDAEALYLWCDVQGHEPLGMYLNATVSDAPASGNGTSDDGTGDEAGTDAEEEANPLPAPGAVLLASAVALAALAHRRRGGR